MKKYLMAFMMAAFMGLMVCGTAFAGEADVITITLNPDECVIEDSNGNAIPVPYGTMDLGSVSIGNRVYALWNNNGKWFDMKDNTQVRFVVNLSTEETHVEMGYMDKNKTRYPQDFTRDGKKYSSTFWVDGNGMYGFYFLNNSAGQITIKSGTLSF